MRLRVPPNVSYFEIVDRFAVTVESTTLRVAIEMYPGSAAESLEADENAVGTMLADCWRSLWRRVLKKNTKQYAR